MTKEIRRFIRIRRIIFYEQLRKLRSKFLISASYPLFVFWIITSSFNGLTEVLYRILSTKGRYKVFAILYILEFCKYLYPVLFLNFLQCHIIQIRNQRKLTFRINPFLLYTIGCSRKFYSCVNNSLFR